MLVCILAWIGAVCILFAVLCLLWAVGVHLNDQRIYRSWAMQKPPKTIKHQSRRTVTSFRRFDGEGL